MIDRKKPSFLNKSVKKNRGQLSIFLGICLIVITTFMACIINVGLFVKAKINLQNAVDAAAWSGAAVQARQLSKIAYLNWEMRNIYKEWVFKYYVLGQLSLPRTVLSPMSPTGAFPSTAGGKGQSTDATVGMNFRMRPLNPSTATVNNDFDFYNYPSICINYGGTSYAGYKTNICELAGVPGLPRFGSIGLAGVGEQHQAFVATMASSKAQDCSLRSEQNFSVAVTWTYGTKTQIFSGNDPRIAMNRMGAWPSALTTAIRIRNLESVVNLAPQGEICGDGVGCSKLINDLETADGREVGMYERPIKAYWSAFRNLGSQKEEGGNKQDLDNMMQETFKLTELGVPSFTASAANSLSNTLIPTTSGARNKYFLDLKLYSINYALLFTVFVAKQGPYTTAGGTAYDTDAKCVGSSTAMPVPGFPLGFVKSPELLTYYPVKGEAMFTGLYFPFSQRPGITLKAYAAAKPFGGRIGPMLFDILNDITVMPRALRSYSYISTIDVPSSSPDFVHGKPIPLTNFWLQDPTEGAGGAPGSGTDIKFVLPNLVYDIPDSSANSDSDFVSSQSPASGDAFQKLEAASNYTESEDTGSLETAGLYNQQQFKWFAGTLKGTSNDEISKALNHIKRPTKYEAMNYLIPTVNNPADQHETIGIVPDPSSETYQLFAPLYGAGTLYPAVGDIVSVIDTILDDNSSAVTVYLDSLKGAAQEIASTAPPSTVVAGSTGVTDYTDAANTIYDLSAADPCNSSLAGKFASFFSRTECNPNIKPLFRMMEEYLSDLDESEVKNFLGTYVKPYQIAEGDIESRQVMTAFMPGPRQANILPNNPEAEDTHPFTGTVVKRVRNFYSTKLVAMENVTDSATGYSLTASYPIYFERHTQAGGGPNAASLLEKPVVDHADEWKNTTIRNLLPATELSEFGTLFF